MSRDIFNTKYHTISDAIIDVCEQNGNSIALTDEDKEYSYLDLKLKIQENIAKLRVHGITSGDHVGILFPNGVELVVAFLALNHVGAVAIPLSDLLHARDLISINEQCKFNYILISNEAKNLSLNQLNIESLTKAEIVWWHNYIYERGDNSSRDTKLKTGRGADNSVCVVYYSSGTTGRPKGIVATNENELWSARAYWRMLGLEASDRVLCPLPLAFCYGLHVGVCVPLLAGATVDVVPHFTPERAISTWIKKGANVLLGVPTMYAMMTEYVKEHETKRNDLPHVRLAASSGSALTRRIREEAREILGIDLLAYYAMTEVRPIFGFYQGKGDAQPNGSVGRIIPGTEVKLVTEGGDDVGASGNVGEIMAKNGSFSGYYFNDVERTDQAVKDGWLCTGDLAYYDDEGFYYVVGRKDDMIISRGKNVVPQEIEGVVESHPGIRTAVLVGIPDQIVGQRLLLVIQLADATLGIEEIRHFCEIELSKWYMPDIIKIVDHMPLNKSGKIIRRELIEMAASEMEEGPGESYSPERMEK